MFSQVHGSKGAHAQDYLPLFVCKDTQRELIT